MAPNRSNKDNVNSSETVPTVNCPPADDLPSLLACLPEDIRDRLSGQTDALYEIVLDLGRQPEARYLDRRCVYLLDTPITEAHLEYVIERVGTFTDDNRAGIERT